MTSTVKIRAHCNNETQVRVTVEGLGPMADDTTILVDGEEFEVAVFDDRVVTVTEEPLGTDGSLDHGDSVVSAFRDPEIRRQALSYAADHGGDAGQVVARAEMYYQFLSGQ